MSKRPVNVYVKRKLELGRLDYDQLRMYALGNTGLNAIKARTKKPSTPRTGPRS